MEIESIQTIIFQYIYLCIVSGVYMGLQNQLEQNFSSVNHNFYLLNSSHVKVILTEPSALRHYQGQIQTTGCRGGESLDPPQITVLFFILLESFVMSQHYLSSWAKQTIGFQLKAGL